MWTKRVGLVVAGAPVAVAAAGIAVVVGSLAVAVGLVPFLLHRLVYRPICRYRSRRAAVAKPVNTTCLVTLARLERPPCLACAGRTTCTHARTVADKDMLLCRDCGHIVQLHIADPEQQPLVPQPREQRDPFASGAVPDPEHAGARAAAEGAPAAPLAELHEQVQLLKDVVVAQ